MTPRRTGLRRNLAVLVVALAGGALWGCTAMKPEDFAGTTPELRIEEYFNGRSKAWGLFQDRFGTIRRQFAVDIDGRWDGTTLTLTEDFAYDDGEKEQRIWRLRKTGPSTYAGRADGVVGEAVGVASGRAFNLRYTFDLKVGDGTWRVSFDDWMVLQPDGVIINRATVAKWGVEIGTVSLFFRRVEQAAANSNNAKGAGAPLKAAALAGAAD
ncbi:MAG: DUF3833 domain-containing protein [Alphaproteobacteria bacterium]|nr:DUF3833 domain-containing protein [Alphaproteobacteria bacterium]